MSDTYLKALQAKPQTARDLAVTLGRRPDRGTVASIRGTLERMERQGLVQRTLAAGFNGPWVWQAVRAEAAENDCSLVAVVGSNRFPCRSHHDGKHHFAAHRPPCPAPFCKLPPGHRGLHDIPAGTAEVVDARPPGKPADLTPSAKEDGDTRG